MNESTRSGALRSLARDDGAIAVVTGLIIAFVLFGVAAIATDVGIMTAKRRQLQTAADAAALAAAHDLVAGAGTAEATAQYYAARNANNLSGVNTSIEDGGTQVTVVVNGPSELAFAKVWGMDEQPTTARATAHIAGPTAYSRRVMPFGIMSAEPSGTAPFGYVFNQSLMLKQPAGKGESGNFQFVALTDPPGGHNGASDITWALSNGGVPNDVYLGELYNTKTGMNGKNVSDSLKVWVGGDTHTFDQVVQVRPDGFAEIRDYACHRLIVCPIIVDPGPPVRYNWIELSGTKPVQVIGFVWVFIESIGTNGNDCYVTGRFIRPLDPQDVSQWGGISPYDGIGESLVN